ncbi:DEAD/DEAH box helicase [Streptococcus halichoeri]|uniref:DEAD/DEAH box helicase n=1 Tax=Streptococcus halichoeri TaxID=254785 RepID=UPI00135C5083|nr:DEAD/DEAH box helicase [Streptococcus halichoeri]
MEDLLRVAGRQLTQADLSPELQALAKLVPAFKKHRGQLICCRCASIASKDRLPDGRIYCRQCLPFGRLTQGDYLYRFAPAAFAVTDCLAWSGHLTKEQQRISDGLIEHYQKGKDSWVHAVTGAGKTEMIYVIAAMVINQGGSVCIASPRIDVCVELFRRLQRDFKCPVVLLHGQSPDYVASQLLIATTHQLLRFFRAFDLLIIDEVDAFPLAGNPVLQFGIQQAKKRAGRIILLTATATASLQKAVRRGAMEKLTLARRFHNQPLVVPQFQWIPGLMKHIKKGQLPVALLAAIKKQRQSAFPLLIFYPTIEGGAAFTHCLEQAFPKETIGIVSSQSATRQETIEAFRSHKVTILVTTTILERGVTFPLVDVFVVGANHHLFPRTCLVQIAGRVGRSVERPTGSLIFFHDGQSLAMLLARREIKQMNRLGGF